MNYNSIYLNSIRIFLSACLFMLGGLFLTAHAESDSDSDKIELIHQFIEVSRFDRNTEAVLKGQDQLGSVTDAFLEDITSGNPNMSPEEEEAIQQFSDNMVNDFDNFMQNLFTKEEIADILVPIFDKYYTTEDLQNLIAFYQTPTGQKMANTLDADVSLAINDKFEEVYMHDIMEAMNKIMHDNMMKMMG